MGRAAELLDLTVYDLHRLAEVGGMELGATDEQRRKSRALAAEVARQWYHSTAEDRRAL